MNSLRSTSANLGMIPLNFRLTRRILLAIMECVSRAVTQPNSLYFASYLDHEDMAVSYVEVFFYREFSGNLMNIPENRQRKVGDFRDFAIW